MRVDVSNTIADLQKMVLRGPRKTRYSFTPRTTLCDSTMLALAAHLSFCFTIAAFSELLLHLIDTQDNTTFSHLCIYVYDV